MGVFTVGRQVALEIDMPGWWLANASVDMDFRRGLYYDSSTANPRAATDFLSCVRASTGYAKTAEGTLTQFASNILRVTSNGLLIEDARTNNKLQSQDFTSGAEWNVINNITTTANTTTAPDGTTTADSVVPTATNGDHSVGGSAGTATAASWTASCYLNPNGYNFGYLAIQNGATDSIWVFDLVAGTSTRTDFGSAPTGVTTAFETLANGWVRPAVTLTAAAAGISIRVGVMNASTYANFAGNTTSGIYAWGAQVEAGAFPSSYIPTSGATATRAAENITTSGSLQTVINAATASLVAQVDNGSVANIAANIVDSNGTNLLGFDASNHGLASMIGTLATGNTANRTTQDKLGLAWNASGRSLVLNGGTVATDASAQTPSATQHIGSSGTANFAFAYIERLSSWTTKLADATLQGFTV